MATAQDFVRARVTLNSCTDGAVVGSATLIEAPSSEGVKDVTILLSVHGLPAGKHGVHIHEVGACSPTCAAAGSHLDLGPFGNNVPVTANHPYRQRRSDQRARRRDWQGVHDDTRPAASHCRPAISASSTRTALRWSFTHCRILTVPPTRPIPTAPAAAASPAECSSGFSSGEVRRSADGSRLAAASSDSITARVRKQHPAANPLQQRVPDLPSDALFELRSSAGTPAREHDEDDTVADRPAVLSRASLERPRDAHEFALDRLGAQADDRVSRGHLCRERRDAAPDRLVDLSAASARPVR